MKAKEKETKKSLSVAELGNELRTAEEKSFRLRFQNQVTPVKNPLEIRNLRRHIARLKTWINEKKQA